MSKLINFIISFVLITLGSEIVYADFLGVFEPGDTIRFGAICQNGTTIAPDCNLNNVLLFGPLDNVLDPGINISNITETRIPGFYRGNYTIGSSNQTGAWTIFLNFSESYFFPVIHHFQLVGDNRGLDVTGRNVNTTLDNTVVINSAVLSVNLSVPNECAKKVHSQNLTTIFYYNRSDFRLFNVTLNYTGIPVFLNQTFTYDNYSYLNKSVQRVHYG